MTLLAARFILDFFFHFIYASHFRGAHNFNNVHTSGESYELVKKIFSALVSRLQVEPSEREVNGRKQQPNIHLRGTPVYDVFGGEETETKEGWGKAMT